MRKPGNFRTSSIELASSRLDVMKIECRMTKVGEPEGKEHSAITIALLSNRKLWR
jgi:hypothetical protein